MADRAAADPKIEFVWNSEVVGLDGDTKLEGVRIRNVVSGEESVLAATGLFVAIGHDPRTELVRGVVDTDAAGYVLVDGRTTATNVRGVFACGDLVDSRYRQAITAAGSGCAAALDTQHFLDELADAETAAGADAPTPRLMRHRRGRGPEPVASDPRRGHGGQLPGRGYPLRRPRCRRLLGHVVPAVPRGRPAYSTSSPRSTRAASRSSRSTPTRTPTWRWLTA